MFGHARSTSFKEYLNKCQLEAAAVLEAHLVSSDDEALMEELDAELAADSD